MLNIAHSSASNPWTDILSQLQYEDELKITVTYHQPILCHSENSLCE